MVGAIGSQILKHFDIVFDLPRGQVSILPIGRPADREISQSENQTVTPITLKNDLVWIPVSLKGRNGTLVTPLAMHMQKWLKVRGSTVHVIDGVRRAPGVGRYRSGERIYEAIRDVVANRLRIEPQSVEVVIVVREASNGAVVQAGKCTLERAEASK